MRLATKRLFAGAVIASAAKLASVAYAGVRALPANVGTGALASIVNLATQNPGRLGAVRRHIDELPSRPTMFLGPLSLSALVPSTIPRDSSDIDGRLTPRQQWEGALVLRLLLAYSDEAAQDATTREDGLINARLLAEPAQSSDVLKWEEFIRRTDSGEIFSYSRSDLSFAARMVRTHNEAARRSSQRIAAFNRALRLLSALTGRNGAARPGIPGIPSDATSPLRSEIDQLRAAADWSRASPDDAWRILTSFFDKGS